jgi:hypothetical protein
MNAIEIRKAKILLDNFINESEYIVAGNEQFTLQVCLKDGSQQVFYDIQHVIDWVQVRKIKQYLH